MIAVLMTASVQSLIKEQLLRLYEIETRQVHSSLDHILTIRGTMALAFAALLSATLVSKQKVIALGGLVFFLAWFWEYFYARYLRVYTARAEVLVVYLRGVIPAELSKAYTGGYDHNPLDKLAPWVGARRAKRGKKPWRESRRLFVITFFDPPRAIAYSAMGLALLIFALVSPFPWVAP